MVNPFTHPGAVVDLCAGFLLLFQTYLQTKRYQLSSGPNELVFQLVPINIIASKNSVAVPTQAEYRALALEVYERCGLGVLPTLDAAVTPGNAPSILLSDNLPTSIDIKLTIEPPSSVLHEPTCLHIAYSQSIDDRWISACWTDNDGNHQMSMAYCLGRRGSESRRPFAEIAREIWETSIEIAKVRKVKWKFLIAKTGIMDPDELDGELYQPSLSRSKDVF